MADDEQVTLVSLDDQAFRVPVKVAKMSATVKHLIEDAGVDNPIPLPEVTGKILARVVTYCKYHTENPEARKEYKQNKLDNLCLWDLDFCK
jgi:S-phase kinase-associated protein 1